LFGDEGLEDVKVVESFSNSRFTSFCILRCNSVLFSAASSDIESSTLLLGHAAELNFIDDTETVDKNAPQNTEKVTAAQ